eukprot:TRINITY_DN11503_c0_g1_i1.p1 TRINITY_DN11503_c0_g1~~TRINITY_DN11503_c0_g1_i1.p1  ORF type:complete len:1045 (+),score=97.17 TRINITY_DN11503_c0_g1_i1:142-3276(+)
MAAAGEAPPRGAPAEERFGRPDGTEGGWEAPKVEFVRPPPGTFRCEAGRRTSVRRRVPPPEIVVEGERKALLQTGSTSASPAPTPRRATPCGTPGASPDPSPRRRRSRGLSNTSLVGRSPRYRVRPKKYGKLVPDAPSSCDGFVSGDAAWRGARAELLMPDFDAEGFREYLSAQQRAGDGDGDDEVANIALRGLAYYPSVADALGHYSPPSSPATPDPFKMEFRTDGVTFGGLESKRPSRAARRASSAEAAAAAQSRTTHLLRVLRGNFAMSRFIGGVAKVFGGKAMRAELQEHEQRCLLPASTHAEPRRLRRVNRTLAAVAHWRKTVDAYLETMAARRAEGRLRGPATIHCRRAAVPKSRAKEARAERARQARAALRAADSASSTYTSRSVSSRSTSTSSTWSSRSSSAPSQANRSETGLRASHERAPPPPRPPSAYSNRAWFDGFTPREVSASQMSFTPYHYNWDAAPDVPRRHVPDGYGFALPATQERPSPSPSQAPVLFPKPLGPPSPQEPSTPRSPPRRPAATFRRRKDHRDRVPVWQRPLPHRPAPPTTQTSHKTWDRKEGKDKKKAARRRTPVPTRVPKQPPAKPASRPRRRLQPSPPEASEPHPAQRETPQAPPAKAQLRPRPTRRSSGVMVSEASQPPAAPGRPHTAPLRRQTLPIPAMKAAQAPQAPRRVVSAPSSSKQWAPTPSPRAQERRGERAATPEPDTGEVIGGEGDVGSRDSVGAEEHDEVKVADEAGEKDTGPDAVSGAALRVRGNVGMSPLSVSECSLETGMEPVDTPNIAQKKLDVLASPEIMDTCTQSVVSDIPGNEALFIHASPTSRANTAPPITTPISGPAPPQAGDGAAVFGPGLGDGRTASPLGEASYTASRVSQSPRGESAARESAVMGSSGVQPVRRRASIPAEADGAPSRRSSSVRSRSSGGASPPRRRSSGAPGLTQPASRRAWKMKATQQRRGSDPAMLHPDDRALTHDFDEGSSMHTSASDGAGGWGSPSSTEHDVPAEHGTPAVASLARDADGTLVPKADGPDAADIPAADCT